MSHTGLVMIHGDATPVHFMYNANEQRMEMIDVETLRSGDLAEDLGYLVTEINHFLGLILITHREQSHSFYLRMQHV